MPTSVQEFWNKELFAVDGLKLTIGVVVVLLVLYWLLFMRR